jgi:hypothetical protein
MANNHRQTPLLEWGVASQPLPGEELSGDTYLVQPFADGVLVAAIDGLGHGAEAAAAAQMAVATLKPRAHESVIALLQHCHDALLGTRGAVMTLASFNAATETVTWVGVGNVEGVLIKSAAPAKPQREHVLLHRGVVGLQLPSLCECVIPLLPGDALILATDGIRTNFTDAEFGLETTPQGTADFILGRYFKETDDGLVIVARYRGGAP